MLLVVQLLFYWVRTKTTVPPTQTQKFMMFAAGSTVVTGVFSVVGALLERVSKRVGVGKYVLLVALGLYIVFAVML